MRRWRPSSLMEFQGTIKPRENFDAEASADRFNKFLKGFGTDERALIHLLVCHNLEQRMEIEAKYKEKYGSDLLDDLKSELGGNFEETVLALMIPTEELLAMSLHDSITNPGTEEKTIIEILCNRTHEEITNLNEIYTKKYEESLEDSMSANLSGDFLHLMTSLVSGGRDVSLRPDPITARKEAQDLYDAGISHNSGSEKSDFTKILNTRSYPQLQETFKEYERISMEPIEKSINNEFSGELKQGLLAIIQRVKDPLGFFAERLNECMRGAGTDDKTLIRIIVSRSEIDLEDIKRRYREMYGSTLVSDVRADTSGDYGKLLLAIVGT